MVIGEFGEKKNCFMLMKLFFFFCVENIMNLRLVPCMHSLYIYIYIRAEKSGFKGDFEGDFIPQYLEGIQIRGILRERIASLMTSLFWFFIINQND
jgi:hypothetical protein